MLGSRERDNYEALIVGCDNVLVNHQRFGLLRLVADSGSRPALT